MDDVVRPSPKKPLRFLLFIVLITLFIAFIVFGISKINESRNTKDEPLVSSPTPTEFVFPTDTPIATSSSPTPNVTQIPTIAPSVNPRDSATGLNRSSLSIEVRNGSGEVGAATKGSDTLKSFGYTVISIGNADSFDYENTTIEIKKEKSAYLVLLKKDLSNTYTIGSTSAILSASSSADAIVILGKE